MQVFWREVFGGDLIVDEFLFYYKPSEINQSLGFYQFTARGTHCRLIKSLASSDRNWKTVFFFIFGFWAGNPVEVGRDTFAPYTGEVGNLCPKVYLFIFLIYIYIYIYIYIAIGWPPLSKFYRDRVHRARLYVDRSFHSLVTLQCLAKWGLGLEPSAEAKAHELTVRRREFSFYLESIWVLFETYSLSSLIFLF